MNEEEKTPLSDEPWFDAMLAIWAELGVLTCLVHELAKYSLNDKQLEDFICRVEGNIDEIIGTVDVNGHDIPEYQDLVENTLKNALASLRKKTPGPFLSMFGFHVPKSE